MPPLEGFTVTLSITVADIERSARFYEKVFGGRILSLRRQQGRVRAYSDCEYVAHCQRGRRAHPGQADGNAQRPRRPG